MKYIYSILLLLVVNLTSAHTEVTETAILGHAEPTPRFSAHYENKLVVPVGETVTLPTAFDYDVIEVNGTLKASREFDTIGKVIHFTVMPSGVLDFGTEADPVTKNVTVIFKDVPLRTGDINSVGIDPFQIGNGLLVFGKFYSHGIKLDKTFTQLKAGVGPNANSLVMDVPAGWKVGDRLLLPDTAQPYYEYPNYFGYKTESPLFIQAINEDVVTLNKAVDFPHELYRDPDGNVYHMPYVANATRNITFKSENPNGVRGHVIFLEQAEVDCRYTAFEGLGRTLAENLDSTETNSGIVTKIGKNQIARYAFHWHHVHGHANVGGYTGKVIGCFLDGNDIAKWGIVQHGTHDVYVAENVGYNFKGGSFVTEDGYEVRGVYDHNFGMGSTGMKPETSGKFSLVPPNNVPGGEGANFWFHGMKQTIRNNVSVNGRVGYEFLFRNQVMDRKVPEVPGGPNTLLFDPRVEVPIQLENNFALNCRLGIEVWNNPILQFNKLYLYNNYVGYAAGDGEGGHVNIKNFEVIQEPWKANHGQTGVHTSSAYTGTAHFENGKILGCYYGLHQTRNDFIVKNVVLQNIINIADPISAWSTNTVYDNVMHKQVPGKPKKYVEITGYNKPLWKHGDPTPQEWYQYSKYSGHPRFRIINWQGTGKNYVISDKQSLGSSDAIWATGYAGYYCPEKNLSNKQCFEKYGLAYAGTYMPDEEVVELEGLDGIAREGLENPVVTPRAVLIQPNAIEPFKDWAQHYSVNLKLTGKKEGISLSKVFYKYDDKPESSREKDVYDYDGFIRVELDRTLGWKTLQTWRADINGNKIPESMLTFKFFNGEAFPDTEPPVDPIPIVVSPIEVIPAVVYEKTRATYKAAASGGNAPLTWKTQYTYGTTTIDHTSGTGNSAEWTFDYPAGARKYTWSITFTDGTQSVTSTKVVDVLATPVDPTDPTVAELKAKIAELEAKIVELNGTIATLQTQLSESTAAKVLLQATIDAFKTKINQVEQLRLELLEMSK